MTKVAYIGDLHFSGNNYEILGKSWEEALTKCIENNVTTVFVAGDIFDSSNIVSHRTPIGTIVKYFKDPMINAVNKGITFYLLVGNHDLTTSNHEHALEIFNNINPNIIVVDEPLVVNVGGVKKIGLMPWVKNQLITTEDFSEGVQEYLKETFSNFKSSGIQTLVGHIELSNYSVNGYRMTGNKYSVTEQELLSICNEIYLGHYHKADKYYIGSLTHLTFNDVGNLHRIIIQDVSTNEITSIDIPCPEHKIINIDDVSLIPKELDKYNKYRLDIKDTIGISEIKHLLSDNVEVKIIKEEHVIARTEEEIKLDEISLFKEYAKLKGYDEEKTNRVLLKLEKLVKEKVEV